MNGARLPPIPACNCPPPLLILTRPWAGQRSRLKEGKKEDEETKKHKNKEKNDAPFSMIDLPLMSSLFFLQSFIR
jgi:hypothetical protein